MSAISDWPAIATVIEEDQVVAGEKKLTDDLIGGYLNPMEHVSALAQQQLLKLGAENQMVRNSTKAKATRKNFEGRS